MRIASFRATASRVEPRPSVHKAITVLLKAVYLQVYKEEVSVVLYYRGVRADRRGSGAVLKLDFMKGGSSSSRAEFLFRRPLPRPCLLSAQGNCKVARRAVNEREKKSKKAKAAAAAEVLASGSGEERFAA